MPNGQSWLHSSSRFLFLSRQRKIGLKIRSSVVISFALMASLILLVACAVVEQPSGGPIDKQPPFLVQAIPDSGVVGLPQFDTIYLSFSEKMDRTSAITWLHFFPDQRIRKTKWHGATMAEIILEAPLPADTTIVIEIPAGMKDAHKVANPRFRSFPIATSDSLLSGSIDGILVLGEGPVTAGVVELYAIPPDTLEYFQQPILRRTVTGPDGRFSFKWLPIPGGPWLLRSFVDSDGNLRPGDKEAQRLIPDTLSLDWENITATSGVTTLFAVNTPGRLLASAFEPDSWFAPRFAWTEIITDADTGWVPITVDSTRTTFFPLLAEGGSVVNEVKPGNNRVFVFADVDGDSTFSAIADSLIPEALLALMPVPAIEDSLSDTHWYLEPHAVMENVLVLPGLDTDWAVPALPDTLLSWTAPPVEEEPVEELPEADDEAEPIGEEPQTPDEE